jgi:hypothetical protein
VQELHLVALHLVCEAMDAELTRQAVAQLAEPGTARWRSRP